jgi:hypothetical protein
MLKIPDRRLCIGKAAHKRAKIGERVEVRIRFEMLGKGNAKKSVRRGDALNVLATVTHPINVKAEARKDGAQTW